MNKILSFQEINFGEKVIYIAPTWKEMGEVVFDLGKQILQARNKYDWLISIAKGGWTWSRALADYLYLDNLASVKTKFYSGINTTTDTLVLEQSLPDSVDIKNKRILLFDDICDSGKTFSVVKKHLLQQNAKSVDTAALFSKPSSSVQPDFFVYQTQAWVVFPHEIREFIRLSRKTWNNLTNKEILNRYTKLGLPKDQVKLFLKLD